jgi:hypothetical protein
VQVRALVVHRFAAERAWQGPLRARLASNLFRNISPMASVPSSEVEAGLRRRDAGNGARAVIRADDLRSAARVKPCLCRRRCHRRDGEAESDQLDGEPLPALHLNSLSRVSCHVSTVRRAVASVVRSRDSGSVKVLTQRSRAASRNAGRNVWGPPAPFTCQRDDGRLRELRAGGAERRGEANHEGAHLQAVSACRST